MDSKNRHIAFLILACLCTSISHLGCTPKTTTFVFSGHEVEEEVDSLLLQNRKLPIDRARSIRLAKIFLEESYPAEAKEVLLSLKKDQNLDKEGMMLLAHAEMLLPFPNKSFALSLLEDISNQWGASAPLQLLYARYFKLSKEQDKVMSAYAAVLELAENSEQLLSAYLGLAGIYEDLSLGDEAEKYMELAREIFPAIDDYLREFEINELGSDPVLGSTKFTPRSRSHPALSKRIRRAKKILSHIQ